MKEVKKAVTDGLLHTVSPWNQNEENMRTNAITICVSLANIVNKSHGPAKGHDFLKRKNSFWCVPSGI